MRKLLLFIVILTAPLLCSSKKILNLDVTQNPESIIVHENKIFVQDQKTAQLYSMSGKKFIGYLGANGDGPGEYRQCLSMYLTPDDKIILLSLNKTIFFDLNGRYLSEMRRQFTVSKFIPIKQKVVFRHFSIIGKKREYQSIYYIADKNFKPEIELHRVIQENPQKKLDVIFFYEGFRVYKDRIYLAVNHDGQLMFKVYDENGIKENAFLVKSEQKEVPYKFITKKKDEIKAKVKKYWPLVKPTLHFKKFFPPIQNFKISSRLIYIKTWIYINENVKFKVIDLKGKKIGEIFLPDAGELFDLTDDKYYYIKENTDSDEWELHELALNKLLQKR